MQTLILTKNYFLWETILINDAKSSATLLDQIEKRGSESHFIYSLRNTSPEISISTIEKLISKGILFQSFFSLVSDLRLSDQSLKERAKIIKRILVKKWPDHPLAPLRLRDLTPEHGAAKTLASKGDVEAALELLDSAPPTLTPAERMQWQLYRETLLSLPGRDSLKRATIKKALSEEYTVTGTAGLGKLAIIFSGIAGGVGMPIHFFDRMLASEGWDAIYLSDFSRQAFLGGLNSLGLTSAECICAHLMSHLKKNNINNILTFGVSAGALAAIKFATYAGITNTHCFSGVSTFLDRDRNELGDNRQRNLTRRIHRICELKDMDASTFLEEHKSSNVKIHMHYAENSSIDKGHAMRISHFKSVILSALKNTDQHSILPELIRNGQIARLLSQH